MNSSRIQITSVGLSAVGLLFAIITCALPKWREVYSSTGVQYGEQGLWKTCGLAHSSGQWDCMIFEDPRQFSSDLRLGRALTIICILLNTLALLAIFACAFINNEDVKHKVRMAAGITLMLAGLLLLIPVSFTANEVNIFNTEKMGPRNVTLGACIYTGWVGAVILMLAGGLHFWSLRNP